MTLTSTSNFISRKDYVVGNLKPPKSQYPPPPSQHCLYLHEPDKLNNLGDKFFMDFSSIDFSMKIYEILFYKLFPPGVIILAKNLVVPDEAGAFIVEDHVTGCAA